ncbi:hypothetical protein ACSDQ9_05245 [Aestuariimicrobium soli]|uniref:hypothetical protein n=1 Tax=Aestuariimicrobium soli TaxID=2035834 RepID=UPI003EB7FB41
MDADGLPSVDRARLNRQPTLPPPSYSDERPATTAGPLTAATQPRPPGWALTPFPDTETSRSNGTAAQRRDAARAAWEAVLVCGGVDRRDWVDPTHALMLNVTGEGSAQGRGGIGLVLQFAHEAEARRYQAVVQRVLQACPDTASGGAPGVQRMPGTTTGTWLGHRTYSGGVVWSEIVVVHGSQVRLWIVQQNLDAGQLQVAARRVGAAR